MRYATCPRHFVSEHLALPDDDLREVINTLPDVVAELGRGNEPRDGAYLSAPAPGAGNRAEGATRIRTGTLLGAIQALSLFESSRFAAPLSGQSGPFCYQSSADYQGVLGYLGTGSAICDRISSVITGVRPAASAPSCRAAEPSCPSGLARWPGS